MPYRALSEHAKSQNKPQVTKEAKLQATLAEYTLEQAKPLYKRRGARFIATAHGITIQWRTVLIEIMVDGRRSLGVIAKSNVCKLSILGVKGLSLSILPYNI